MNKQQSYKGGSPLDAFCLEEIIVAQADEPAQKNCIYRISLDVPVSPDGEVKPAIDKFI